VLGTADGDVLIPARKLAEIVKSLGSEGMLDVTVDEKSLQITLRTSFGEYFIKGMDAEEFPVIPEFPAGTTITLPCEDVQRISSKTTFAVSKEEYRPAMTGVYFQFTEDELITVATDGYRLVKVTTKSNGTKFPSQLTAIIPARVIDLLETTVGDVVIAVNKTHARFIMNETTIITRLIDEKYPSYENVIPKDNNKVCVVKQSELSAAIRRVSIFTSQTSPQLRFNIKGSVITVSAEDTESGNRAKEIVPCDFDSDTLEIGFNYKYIEETLLHVSTGAKDNQIDLLFSTATRAVLIVPHEENSSLLMLVMPMRIS
jgi:DNA polymerase-3 subunit beta